MLPRPQPRAALTFEKTMNHTFLQSVTEAMSQGEVLCHRELFLQLQHPTHKADLDGKAADLRRHHADHFLESFDAAGIVPDALIYDKRQDRAILPFREQDVCAAMFQVTGGLKSLTEGLSVLLCRVTGIYDLVFCADQHRRMHHQLLLSYQRGGYEAHFDRQTADGGTESAGDLLDPRDIGVIVPHSIFDEPGNDGALTALRQNDGSALVAKDLEGLESIAEG